MLKVKLELEVARILSSAARLGAELSEAADAMRSRRGTAMTTAGSNGHRRAQPMATDPPTCSSSPTR